VLAVGPLVSFIAGWSSASSVPCSVPGEAGPDDVLGRVTVAVDIRGYRAGDRDAVIALSLRAWAPVFASMNDVVGTELAGLLHGEDWREYQARSVSESLVDSAKRGWVAQADGQITGFVVSRQRIWTGA
jgi:hypothetical protein